MIAKKKGRRPKSYYENLKLLDLSNNIIIQGETGEIQSGEIGETVVLDSSTNVVHKKRGPKEVN